MLVMERHRLYVFLKAIINGDIQDEPSLPEKSYNIGMNMSNVQNEMSQTISIP